MCFSHPIRVRRHVHHRVPAGPAVRPAQQRHGATPGRVQNGGGSTASRARVLLHRREYEQRPNANAVVLRQLYQARHVDTSAESVVRRVRLVQREYRPCLFAAAARTFYFFSPTFTPISGLL